MSLDHPGLRHAALATALLLPALAAAAPWSVTVTDASGQPLDQAAVAVYVKSVHSAAAAGTTAQIGQKNRQFQPQVTVMQTGTAVLFPNFDTVRHHVYSFSPTLKFELKLYAGTPAAPVLFDKPGVAVLGCNIHDRMQAWIYVVDTPLFATTDAAGHATLDLPAGDHQVQVWHYRQAEGAAPTTQPLRMGAAAGAATLRVAVDAAI